MMPLTAAQLAQLEANQAAVDAATTKQAIFINSLVADPVVTPSGLLFGMYVQDEPGSMAAINSRLPALGNPKVAFVHNFASYTDAKDLSNLSWITGGAKNDGVPNLLISTGMIVPFGQSAAVKSTFASIGQNLTNAGYSAPKVRIGIEMNGGFAWSAKPNPTAWKADFMVASTALKSTCPGALVDLNVAIGNGWDWTAADPGPAYVDTYGVDIYPQSWSVATNNLPTNSQAVWNGLLNAPYDGLNAMVAHAAKQGRPLTSAEASCIFRTDTHGTGDDALFVQNLNTFATTYLEWICLFCTDQNSDGQSDLTDGKFPNALAAFKALTW